MNNLREEIETRKDSIRVLMSERCYLYSLCLFVTPDLRYGRRKDMYIVSAGDGYVLIFVCYN
jgi:hypothetical protein